MTYTTSNSVANGFVSLMHTDAVSMDELEEGHRRANALLHKHACLHLLVDVCAMTTIHSTPEHFELSSKHGDVLPLWTRVAVLMRPEIYHYARFAETVAVNRRFDVHLFCHRGAVK